MTQIDRLVQKPFPGIEVDMYDLDLTPKGGDILHFTNWVREDGTPIVWRGITYIPVAMEASGWEISGEGKPPRPKIRIGNGEFTEGELAGTLVTFAATYDDFVGCQVTRWRTYRQFLDDGDAADPATYFPLDKFRVSAKTEETFAYIEWELAMKMDTEGMQIPKGIMTQKYCPLHYRVYDDNLGDFNYNRVTCPYDGGQYFTEQNEATADPHEDRCSKRLSGCRLRFGTTAPLPFGGFAGMRQVTGQN